MDKKKGKDMEEREEDKKSRNINLTTTGRRTRSRRLNE